jgi:hypothetical protein
MHSNNYNCDCDALLSNSVASQSLRAQVYASGYFARLGLNLTPTLDV